MPIDLSSLTDDQIRVMAAEAMGCCKVKDWPERSGVWKSEALDEWWVGPNGVDRDLKFDPLHDLNDAVALADHVCIKRKLDWRVAHWISNDEGYEGYITDMDYVKSIRTVDQLQAMPLVSITADSPARALTLAVLTAMQTEKRDE